MTIDIVDAIQRGIRSIPEARDAIESDRLWAFVESLKNDPELHAIAVCMAQHPALDLQTISVATGTATSERHVLELLAKLYEHAANWRVGNYRGRKTIVRAPENLCITSLEEYGIVLSLMLEEDVVEEIEAQIAPDWLSDVRDDASSTSARAIKNSISLQIKKWGDFLLPPLEKQALTHASAASEQVNSEKEDTKLLVTFIDEHSGAEASIAIIRVNRVPRVALISSDLSWLSAATNLYWKGDSIKINREAGYLLLDIAPLKARKLCRRAYEDSEQEVPCLHFTTNG